jgi:hypothetical protein
MEQGLYLYCLARLSRIPALPLEGVGLDGTGRLQVAKFRDLAAVWSPVDLADFCGPQAEKHLEDLSWIGPRVIRHQEVVAGVMRHSPVLPARFGTIFSTMASLEQVLRRRHDTIAAVLERLADREEWAVKGLLDRALAKERLFLGKLAQEAARLEDLSPGKRYFEEQRLRAACDRELPRWLKEVRRELWADLGGYATEARERRLLPREVTGQGTEMIFNWAFLVFARDVATFQDRIKVANARLADFDLRLECTGPWPPYSFCPALDPEAAP